MPQISATIKNPDTITDINKLASKEYPGCTFSSMVDILLTEAVEARNKAKNGKK